MLTIPFGTTATIDLAVADADAAAVEGATVELTIEDAGTEVLEATAMTDMGGGNYSYTVAAGLLTKPRYRYTAKVTAESGGFTAYAEIRLYTAVDDTWAP